MNLKRFILIVLFAAACVFTYYATLPGDVVAGPKGGEYERFDWRGGQDDAKDMEAWAKQKRPKRNQDEVPENALYMDECSACHFLYQPWLLPSESWKLVMENSEEHFGDDLALEEEDLNEILAYLVDNGAEKSRAYNEWAGSAGKIVRSLRGAVPESIREVPYIRRKHREVNPKVFDRPAIQSFSNCVACHKAAGKGDYDKASIPKKKRKAKP